MGILEETKDLVKAVSEAGRGPLKKEDLERLAKNFNAKISFHQDNNSEYAILNHTYYSKKFRFDKRPNSFYYYY